MPLITSIQSACILHNKLATGIANLKYYMVYSPLLYMHFVFSITVHALCKSCGHMVLYLYKLNSSIYHQHGAA